MDTPVPAMDQTAKCFISHRQLLELRSESSSENECVSKVTENQLYANVNVESLRNKIKRVSEKVKTRKKNKSKNLDEYLDSVFLPPEGKDETLLAQVTDEKQKYLTEKIISQTKTVVQENRSLKRQYVVLQDVNAGLQEKINHLTDKLENAIEILSHLGSRHEELIKQSHSNELRDELEKARAKYEKQSALVEDISMKLKEAQHKISTYTPRNVNKKLKRRDETIEKMKVKLENAEKSNESIRRELAGNSEEIANVQQLKKEKHTVQKHVSKLKQQLKALKEKNIVMKTKHEEDLFESNTKLEASQKEIGHLQAVVDLMESDMINTFCDGKYTNEVRECCMKLMTECNVSMSKLPNVIRVVLTSFTGKVPQRLPSKTLLNWLMAEAKVVASKHVASEMISDLQSNVKRNQGNVLHQDATTKFHQHFEGAQVTLVDGRSLTVGLKQVAGGDGQTYFSAFKDMVHDLASALGHDKEKNSAELICSIKHFMSDQCATNAVFNSLVQELRQELIPAVCENYQSLTDEEKAAINDMGKFACRLHLLATFGTDADKALAAFEGSIAEGKNPYAFNSAESGSFRLCRTAAKALTKRGSDKAGVNAYWEAYLKGKCEKNHLVTFKGHRINIAFHEGAAVYHHRHDISDFLKDPNGLLKSLAFDIKEPGYLAGCRALGIFDKLATGPFWRILEQEGSILDLNQDLNQMQLTLSRWAEDGSIPFSGETMFGEPATEDMLYSPLFSDSGSPSEDALTIMALELLSAQLLVLLERQARSQLPDGEYYLPHQELQESAKNVPKTNTISERDMAVLDNLLRSKPSASTLTLEAIVMCSKNKPFEWLQSLSPDDKMKVLEDARRQGKSVKEEFLARKHALEKNIAEKLIQKKAKVEEKGKKKT